MPPKNYTMQAYKALRQAQSHNATLFFVNVVLLWTLGAVVANHLDEVSFFSYPWTFRKTVSGYSAISKLYLDNLDVTANGLDMLHKDTNDLALCHPVTYDGTLEWKGSAVSPMCNCMRNMHLMYVAEFVPNGTPKTSTEMEAMATERTRIKNDLEQFCFKDVRPTQYEGMHSTGSVFGTNIVLGTIMWNMVACAASYYIYWHSNSIDESDSTRKLKPSYTTYWMGYWGLFLVLLHWPLFFVIFNNNNGAEVALITVFTVLFYVIVGFMMFMHVDNASGYWTFPQNIVFWLQYSINLALVFTACNALMQRRDDVYNVVFIMIGVIIGLIALCIDYSYLAFQEFKGQNIGNTIKNLYDSIGTYGWMINGILIISIFNFTAPSFPNTPFSNTASVIWFVLPVLLIIPLLNEKTVTSNTQPNEKKRGDQTEMLVRGWLDMFARFIFTAALIIDLGNTDHNDNMFLMGNN